MIKKLKYLLIIFPIILFFFLMINIHTYNNTKKELDNLKSNISDYKNKHKETITQKDTLTTEIHKVKEEKKDKIEEYNRWIKWNQEIISKIN